MYIDPNTGGMLFQILAAAFAVFTGTVLVFSGRIRALMARFRRYLRERRGIVDEEVQPPAAEESTTKPE